MAEAMAERQRQRQRQWEWKRQRGRGRGEWQDGGGGGLWRGTAVDSDSLRAPPLRAALLCSARVLSNYVDANAILIATSYSYS